MDTLRRLQAYCEARGKCKGCELAYETSGAYTCALESAPEGWELDRFEEEIGEIAGKRGACVGRAYVEVIVNTDGLEKAIQLLRDIEETTMAIDEIVGDAD